MKTARFSRRRSWPIISDSVRGAARARAMIESEAMRGDLTRHALPEEALFEEKLRPRTLSEMIGQDRLRENLAVFIRAARRARSRPRPRATSCRVRAARGTARDRASRRAA